MASDEPPDRAPLGVGSLAASCIARGALLTASLARGAGDGTAAAQAQRIGARAEALAVANDTAFAAATAQLAAAAAGAGDGFGLELSLGDAASAPCAIGEAACDLALLASELARTCDGARRPDYAGVAQIAAAAAATSELLVRANLVVGDADPRLATARAAAAEAARAAARALDSEG